MNALAAPTRVLLVEPHADTRELYDWGLTAAGFAVQAADDGMSAIAAMAISSPALVVSETRVPGFDVLLRRCAAAGVPVVALTTNPFSSPETTAVADLAAVLLKPCLPDELTRVVRGVLGQIGGPG